MVAAASTAAAWRPMSTHSPRWEITATSASHHCTPANRGQMAGTAGGGATMRLSHRIPTHTHARARARARQFTPLLARLNQLDPPKPTNANANPLLPPPPLPSPHLWEQRHNLALDKLLVAACGKLEGRRDQRTHGCDCAGARAVVPLLQETQRRQTPNRKTNEGGELASTACFPCVYMSVCLCVCVSVCLCVSMCVCVCVSLSLARPLARPLS